jgi:2-amino-4-hydroxy-6-hydroxymethyldihydropteridine diphosphokinase
MELLRYMPGVALMSVSRYRDTRPIGGPPGQGVFLNGACLLETDLPPHDVLGMLAAVENTLDRERGERWGPRTVDLDLLLYDDIVLDTAALTLPHPRMVTRRFVLEPCVEIAPDLVHPVAGCTLEGLLASISSPHPHVAVVGVPGSGATEIAAAIAHATLARLVSAPPEYSVVGGMAARRDAVSDALAWRHAVEACAKPLLAKRWPPDPHGTVTDYWLDTVRLAAADVMETEPLRTFESFFARVAAETVSPHVAILLVASPDALEERVAFGARQTAVPASDVLSVLAGRPLEPAGASAFIRQPDMAVCSAADESVARLLRLQERMITAIRCPGPNAARPRAVVTIAAEDLGQAVQEAVAAVEAMA